MTLLVIERCFVIIPAGMSPSRSKHGLLKRPTLKRPLTNSCYPMTTITRLLQLPSFTSYPIDPPLCHHHQSRLSSSLNPDSQPQLQIHMGLDFVKMTRIYTLLVLLSQSLWAFLFQTQRQSQQRLPIVHLPLPSACIVCSDRRLLQDLTCGEVRICCTVCDPWCRRRP
jgi:hypothetical protein